jgi:hypothetical protein
MACCPPRAPNRVPAPDKPAPENVQEHSGEFFDQARVLVGDRFAEDRFDPDRGLRVTIVDLADQDVAAITELAERLSIAEWVRIEGADPKALQAWEQLRHDVIRLEQTRPGALQAYPTPDPGYRRPPITIRLAADAEPVAAELHASYGDFVSLRVGALPYPPTPETPETPSTAERADRMIQGDRASPAEMHIVLEAPLRIRSGQVATHALLLTNLSQRALSVHTDGHLTAIVVDETGAPVGGFTGGRRLPLYIFTARPSETVRIPVLVGTASYRPELGYAIPAGLWWLRARLDLSDGRQLVTPDLEVTITR